MPCSEYSEWARVAVSELHKRSKPRQGLTLNILIKSSFYFSYLFYHPKILSKDACIQAETVTVFLFSYYILLNLVIRKKLYIVTCMPLCWKKLCIETWQFFRFHFIFCRILPQEAIMLTCMPMCWVTVGCFLQGKSQNSLNCFAFFADNH